MNSVRGQEGYTIAELSLFLGISALLLIMALIGTGATVRSTRFTDSTRSLHAYVQQQYDDLLNGVNSRSGAEACASGAVDITTPQTPGTSNCLFMGKLVVLKQGTSVATSYNIVGTEPATADYAKPDEQLIYDFTPTIVANVGVDTFQIPWQASVSGSKRPVDGNAVDAFALIRSPRSTRIVSYVYKEPGASYSLASLINPSVPADVNNIGSPATFCLTSADGFSQPSEISITGGQGQDAIGVMFSAPAGDCNGT